MVDSSDRTKPSFLKRMSIGTDAMSYQGCHYLWGSAGATPGKSDGAWYRPAKVDWETNEVNSPAKAMVWAASCSVDPPKRICPGCYQEVPGGRDARPSDVDLINYLNQLKQIPDQNSWPAYFERFTPRVANWKEGSGETEHMVTQLVWGDDCRGVRHFDCIGFINYVLMDWNVRLVASSQGDIDWFHSNLEDVSGQEPWPADIVGIGGHHIGILMNETRVVHAFQSVSGVIMEAFSAGTKGTYKPGHSAQAGKWSWRGRIPDGYL